MVKELFVTKILDLIEKQLFVFFKDFKLMSVLEDKSSTKKNYIQNVEVELYLLSVNNVHIFKKIIDVD